MEGDINHPWRNWFLMLCIWAAFGLVGGAVHACEDDKHITKKRMLSSLLTSAFAGMVGGMIFQYFVQDPMFIGGIGAVCGYFGQLSLVMLRKYLEKRTGLRKE